MDPDTIYIDGTGLVLGRLASWLAQQLQAGQKVVVVNCQDMLISGNRRSLINHYLQTRARATHTNPKRGPFFPRFPDRILRRTVRGMLPKKNSSGKIALHRLSTYIRIPDKLGKIEYTEAPVAKRSLNNRYMTVGELSRAIGWQHKE